MSPDMFPDFICDLDAEDMMNQVRFMRKNKYQEYIILRKDLLVPQDIRERKGSYFTPQMWVEKSQEYLASVLGDNWQEEYYIWDCCAGTGNMEVGLTNKFNVWASTIDQADVDIMIERAKNGAHLLESHIFQMDFLNDEFEKKDGFPKDLLAILKDPEKRKKLIIYINPPYAEVSSVGKKGKAGVNLSKTHKKYKELLGTAGREVYSEFLMRIYKEIPECIIGEFSKLKVLQGSAFSKFRQFFTPKLIKMFAVPAWTFDNVSGEFPIGFKIWDTKQKESFKCIKADVFDEKDRPLGKKIFTCVEKDKVINKWISQFKANSDINIGFLCGTNGNDFQQNKIVYIVNKKEQMANPRGIWITNENLIQCSVYNAIRHCIDKDWINDRDQFLYPKDTWQTDTEFQADCLAFSLFSGSNVIKSTEGVNHWIPFTEQEVSPRNNFESHFMTDYIKEHQIQFSSEAQGVLEAGKALWKYYHSQPDSNPNASFYDIKEYFKGRNDKGTMNKKSGDENYNVLIWDVEQAMKKLQKKIVPKIYDYGFLLAQ